MNRLAAAWAVSPSPGETIICPECRQFPCIGHPGTRAASEGEA
jgi:hypothetical protein